MAKAVADQGIEVVVATRVNAHGEAIRRAGLKLVPIGINRGGLNPAADLLTLATLMRVYASERPDVVHHVALKPIIYGSVAARLVKVPYVVNAFAGLGEIFIDHEPRYGLLKRVIGTALKVALGPANVRVICQNPDDLDLLVRKRLAARNRSVVIRSSGVDTEKFCPGRPADGDPIAILGARMLWTKGVGDFVEAARQLKSAGKQVRMVLVGEPDSLNPASVPRRQLEKWRNEGVIEWWGWRDDMAALLGRSAVAVLPSYAEGVPKFLVEAASAGLPLVSYDVRGCREVVRNGENGILVRFKNSIGLAEAIASLLDDKAMRQRMGEVSRRIAVSEFSEEQVVQETMALYRSLLADYESPCHGSHRGLGAHARERVDAACL